MIKDTDLERNFESCNISILFLVEPTKSLKRNCYGSHISRNTRKSILHRSMVHSFCGDTLFEEEHRPKRKSSMDLSVDLLFLVRLDILSTLCSSNGKQKLSIGPTPTV